MRGNVLNHDNPMIIGCQSDANPCYSKSPTGKTFRFVSCVRASGRGEAKLRAGVRRCSSWGWGFRLANVLRRGARALPCFCAYLSSSVFRFPKSADRGETRFIKFTLLCCVLLAVSRVCLTLFRGVLCVLMWPLAHRLRLVPPLLAHRLRWSRRSWNADRANGS